MNAGGRCPWATLETLDPAKPKLTPADLHERLFVPLATHFVGITVAGSASAHYEQSGPWGAELPLPSGEQLVLRVSPPNLLQIFDANSVPDHVIVVFRRRCRTSAYDQTRFCLFWHRASAANRITDFQQMERTGFTVGGRNCPLFALRVFCHHDARRTSSAYHGSEDWATIDQDGFQIVRPHAYSVVSHQVFATHPAPGMSQWCLAAACLGLDLADARRRPLEVIPQNEWENQNKRLGAEVRDFLQEEDEKEPKFSHACANAFLATDALDCLGCVSFLGSTIYEGAWPDALHLPSGVPLVIAACVRLATSHRRFGLGTAPTPGDELSNDRFRSCFESAWNPLDEQRNLATDLAIQRAMYEASEMVGNHLVRDHVQSYRRSGQSCISRSFGLTRQDFSEADFSTSKVHDIVTAAYAAFAKAEIGEEAAIQNPDIDFYSPDLCPLRSPTQKTIILFVVSSVERWLRLGSYGGTNDMGAHHEKMQRRRVLPAGELRAKVRSGLAATIARQAGAEGEEQTRRMVERLTKRLEEILQECDDETTVRCPTEEELLDLDKVPDLFTDAEPGDEDDGPGLDEASMQAAVNVLKMLFSQGPAAMFRLFGMQTTLFSECAKISCADCDAEVNLLDTFLFQSSCPHCHRPRCLQCAEVEMKKKKKRDLATSCLRCKKA